MSNIFNATHKVELRYWCDCKDSYWSIRRHDDMQNCRNCGHPTIPLRITTSEAMTLVCERGHASSFRTNEHVRCKSHNCEAKWMRHESGTLLDIPTRFFFDQLLNGNQELEIPSSFNNLITAQENLFNRLANTRDAKDRLQTTLQNLKKKQEDAQETLSFQEKAEQDIIKDIITLSKEIADYEGKATDDDIGNGSLVLED